MRGLLHLDLDAGASVPAQRTSGADILVCHRNDWLTELIAAALAERGLRVTRLGQDPDAVVATLTRTPPAILLVSERLLRGSGLQLVRHAGDLSPSTVCVVQLEADGNLPEAVASGASAVLSRGVSVPDLVGLLDLLADRPSAGHVLA